MTEYRKSFVYCILFCLSLTVYAGYDIRSSYFTEEENARIRVNNTSFLIGEWIKGAFMASDYVLRDIIGQVPLTALQYPDPDPVRHKRITDFIVSKLKTLPFGTVVGMANMHCITTHAWLTPPRSASIGFDGSQREWCKRPKADPLLETFVTNMFVDNVGTLSVNQIRRFPGHANEFNGVATIAVELGFFSKWLEKVSIGSHGILAIADMNTQLLARKPPLPAALGKKVNDGIVTSFVTSEERFKSFSGQSPLDGETRLYSARKVDGLPFVVVVGEANQDWQASWRQRIWITSGAILLLSGMAIFILRYYWNILRHREELALHANTDALTGIANRRSFMNQAEQELKRAQRHDTPLVLLVLDIDHFKQINDTYGHATGDRAIIEFSKACLEAMRDVDCLGRLGGDEFVILLPNTSAEQARVVAERVCHTVRSHEVLNDDGAAVLMTCSIGATMVDPRKNDIDDAVTNADAALYVSKQNGRNRVEFADIQS